MLISFISGLKRTKKISIAVYVSDAYFFILLVLVSVIAMHVAVRYFFCCRWTHC